MAIQFARIEIVGRSSGGNACCKGAYNARAIVKDNKTNITYNFKHKGNNVYHTVLLPEHADKKFSSIAEFMNEVEHCEKRKDSQLLKDIVLALPDDKELTLQDRINITHLLIEKRAWVKEGLGVQVDVHEPHDGEKNWHAHLLVTTRRFTEDGKSFGLKATDLNPEFKKVGGKSFAIPEAEQIHEDLRDIINDYFKMLGLENRVDAISQLGQEHVGPVRMRSVLNKAVLRNEERREANIEQLNSSDALLERVVANKSIFTANDIKRELKCINDTDRSKVLLNEALGHSSIIALSDHNGNGNGLFTTKEVRAEEQKILRLAGYVANEKNVIAETSNLKGNVTGNELLSQINSSTNLTQEQIESVKYLLQNGNGIRILQGRAGTGKSHVLGKVCSISESMGINVIGIAPTHKARTELAKVGYEQNDTIKGMLFKLHNGRFSLPKNSLIVVDEAGMVANSDYQELMRVAATRRCNVILAGDDKQLSSVSRGGMFEVLADKFGSCEIANIQRQNENWGREVAMCFSHGDAKSGLSILEDQGRIKWGNDAGESMSALLLDWHRSKATVSDKIIIAVENKNVEALNAGARQYLKASGYLVGDEYSIAGRDFMRGDRVLITRTDKSLGVTNGDIGTVEYADSNKFVLSLGSGKNTKQAEFNPSEYNGFRHGYATTVFKAQGASIKDVYVFHDGFSGMRNSYVALSRHVEELNLYANEKATGGMDSLVKQMSHKLDKGSSLAYLTQEEVLQKEQEAINPKGLFSSLVDSAKRGVRTFMDKHLPESEYYNYKEPAREILPVEKVINDVASLQEKVAVGDNSSAISNSTKAGAELNNNSNRVPESSVSYAKTYNAKYDMQPIWDRENVELRHNIKFKAEFITKDLLGEPNRKLSNGKELRYGEHGKLAVRISGEKSGTWYDFSESKGGDMFGLVQHTKGSDFREAAEYLRSSVGMASSARPNLQLVYDHESRDNFTDAHKAKNTQEAADRQKVKYTNDLHARSKAINSKNVAHRYLTLERGITYDLGTDIKTAGIYDKGAGKSFPALVAFARNSDGNITGGQRLLLDGKTGTKANVEVARKSFGSISGSFIGVYNNEEADITIIAEGLETALSVSQSLREHSNIKNITYGTKTLCSLGISNIKNYSPSKAEKIIIAADNDGENAVTAKTIANAKAELQVKGAIVEIVRPEVQGDFNDMLKAGNSKGISEIFNPVIEKHVERIKEETIESKKIEAKESFIREFHQTISEFESRKRMVFLFEKLRPIIREEQVFLKEAYSSLKIPIEDFGYDTRKYLETGKIASEKPEMLEDVFKLADKLVAESSGFMEPTVSRHLHGSGNISHLHRFLSEQLEYNAFYNKPREVAANRLSSKTIRESFWAIEKEQNIYADMHGKINHYSFNEELVARAENAFIQRENNELDKLKEIAQKSLDVGAKTKSSLLKDLSTTIDLKESKERIGGDIENHAIKETLSRFELEKEKSETTRGILDTLGKRQDYLCNIDEELEYPEHINQESLGAISLSKFERQENMLNSLDKLLVFIANEKLHTHDEIMHHFKETNSIKECENSLTESYYKKYLNNIEKDLSTLEKEGKLNLNGKTFDCPKQYLEFKEKSSNTHYMPREGFQQIQEQVKESQVQKTIEVTRSFGNFERE